MKGHFHETPSRNIHNSHVRCAQPVEGPKQVPFKIGHKFRHPFRDGFRREARQGTYENASGQLGQIGERIYNVAIHDGEIGKLGVGGNGD